MKRFLYIAIVILLGASCANEDYLVYDITQKDGVYLDVPMFKDSIHYTFGLENISEKVLYVKVALMGMPKNYKRLVNFKIETDSVANDDASPAREEMYSIPDSIWIEADSVVTTLPITINRLKALEDTTFIISFNLTDSKDLDVKGLNEYQITFNDQIPRYFKWWDYSLGAVTKPKVLLIMELYKNIEDINQKLYENMVEKYGEHWEKASWYSTPFRTFRAAVQNYIVKPLYQEYLKRPDELGYMPEPR